MKKMKKKEKGGERKEREIRAGADRGPWSATLSGRVRARTRPQGKGSGGLEIGRLEQRKFPGIRVQGFRRILSSTMKSF